MYFELSKYLGVFEINISTVKISLRYFMAELKAS